MKIEEAIRQLRRADSIPNLMNAPDFCQAVSLGIEALKRLQDNRRDPEFDHWLPLPGETQSPS